MPNFLQGRLPPLIFVIFILIFLSGIGFLFYTFKSNTLFSSCLYNDPNTCQFLDSLTYDQPFAARILSETEDGEFRESRANYIDQNNFQITNLIQANKVSDIIVTGNNSYIFDSENNKWYHKNTAKGELESIQQFLFYPFGAEFTEPDVDRFSFIYLKKEECFAMQCFRYKYADSQNSEQNSETNLLFDDQAFLLRKIIQIRDGKTIKELEYYYSDLQPISPPDSPQPLLEIDLPETEENIPTENEPEESETPF